MFELDYFIFTPVKRFIATLAKIERYLLIIILLTALAEIGIIVLFGLMEGLLFGMVSDQLLSILTALMSLTVLWGHHTLLANRGLGFTRFLSIFTVIMGGISLACSIYTICTDTPLLVKQAQAPIFLATVYFITSLLNLPNMAAAPTKYKILIPLFFFFLTGAIATVTIPPLCLLFKIPMVCTGIPLLRILEQIAPLIISMPEQN